MKRVRVGRIGTSTRKRQTGLRRFLKFLGIGMLILLLAVLTAWSCLALWFRLPGPEIFRMAAATVFLLIGIAAIIAQFGSRRLRALTAFMVGFGGVVLWWGTIHPFANANWAPDVARQVTGTVQGDMLTLTGVREFGWRGDTDMTQRWTTRSYDLSAITSLDLFMSYWAGPAMAHFILSFGFSDGTHLAWSVEVRRQVGGGFSPIADFFKTNTVVVIAAEERDVVGLRTNIRREDVQLYRLNTPPETQRALLMQFVGDANRLAKSPEFFNSITSNCTTTVFRMMRAMGVDLPLDWRMVVNGYLPEYAYEHGVLDMTLPMSELRARSHVSQKGQQAGLGDGYSQAIRSGVPSPLH